MNISIKINLDIQYTMSVLKSHVAPTDGASLSLMRRLNELVDEINEGEIFLNENGQPRRITEKELVCKNIKEFSMLDGYRENIKLIRKNEALEMRCAITNSTKRVMRQ